MSDRHADTMRRLPFGQGLTLRQVTPLLADAGFVDLESASHGPIARAQRETADLRNKLRTFVYRRFVLSARKPPMTASINLRGKG